MRRHFATPLVVFVAFLCFIVGLLGVMLPVLPGVPFLVAALALLSTRFSWAKRILERIRGRLEDGGRFLGGFKDA